MYGYYNPVRINIPSMQDIIVAYWEWFNSFSVQQTVTLIPAGYQGALRSDKERDYG